MIVVLPDEKHGNLSKLIANLNVDDIINFIDGKKWTVEVHVTLPKFEVEFEKEMKEPLENVSFILMLIFVFIHKNICFQTVLKHYR